MKKKPVLMIHGLNDTAQKFAIMSTYLRKRGYQTHAIDLKPNFGIADLKILALQVKTYIDKNFLPEEKIILIGFSMGGLVTRYYLQRLEGINKVDKYISISAPNNGSALAYLLPLPFKGIEQMRPYSSFLEDLNTDVQQQLNQIESLVMWTPFDTMIIPADSSLMGVGEEVCIPIQIHRWMSSDEKVLQKIIQFIER